MKTILVKQIIRILLFLNKSKSLSMSKLAKEMKLSYSNLCTKLKSLEEQGLVYFIGGNDERVKIPKLTHKGVEIVRLLNEMMEGLR